MDMQHGAPFSQLLVSESRRSEKWFQQMGLGLIRPSVSEVQENERLGLGLCCEEFLYSYVSRFEPKTCRSVLGSCRAAYKSHLLSNTNNTDV